MTQLPLPESGQQRPIARARGLYSARSAAMQAALAEHAPEGTSWTRPTGGFFTWLTLPDGADCHQILDLAIDNKVVFVPGTAFRADGSGRQELRLAYSLKDEPTLAEGVRRVCEAIGSATR